MKVVRYVLLSLCVLGLVFQPVNIFADDSIYRVYSTPQAFVNGIIDYYNTAFSLGLDTDLIVSAAPSGYPSISTLTDILQNNNYNYAQTAFLFRHNSSNKLFVDIFVGGTLSYLSNNSSYGTMLYISNSTNNYICYNVESLSLNQSNFVSSNVSKIIAYNSNISHNSSYLVDGIYLNDGFSVWADSSPLRKFTYDTGYVADNTGSGSSSGSGSSIDYTAILQRFYLQQGLLISANFRSYTPDGVAINSSWVGVGEYLTYDYLCKQNPSSSTVSVTLSDGTTVSRSNWIYNLDHHLTYLRSGQELMYNKLNSIALNTNEIGDIADRLELAFPDNQAAMNDSIADSVLDDSNGTGLTVSKISSAKSDLDTGISTFEVDNTGISWSNPFTALLNLDWAWFSQTTAQNLTVQDGLQSDLDYSGLQYYNSVNSYYDDGN